MQRVVKEELLRCLDTSVSGSIVFVFVPQEPLLLLSTVVWLKGGKSELWFL